MQTSHDSDKLRDDSEKPSLESDKSQAQEEHIHRRKDELLDQGVEETFPASDPVAVKHIT